MKQVILVLTLAISAAVGAGARPAQSPKPVQGEGCMQAGVEAHCLVVKDLKTGHLYNLFFKGAPPPVGLGIEFTGLPHDGPTACMQGVALDVTNWARKESLKCAPGEAGKAPGEAGKE